MAGGGWEIINKVKKNMTHKTNYSTGYPMNFKHSFNGDNVTIDLCNDAKIDKGDKIELINSGIPFFTVTKILEHRLPAIKSKERPDNVNHHPEGVMFYKIEGVLPYGL